MLLFFIKSSFVLLVLYGFYKLILERESFFEANRFYLLFCLLLVFSLPFFTLPKIIDNQGIIDKILIKNKVANHQSAQLELKALDQVSENHLSATTPKDSEIKKMQVTPKKQNPDKGYSSMSWLLCFYFFGVVILSLNLLLQIFSVFKKLLGHQDKLQDEGITIVNLTDEIEPCSFFNFIFINPSLYDFDTYEQIIAHEKIHVLKKHSLDLLVSELAVIALWFNPLIWKMRKDVEKNIEYQTDELLIKSNKAAKESYQLNLVRIAAKTAPLVITTNYNQSLIKQRILKMNGKKSNAFNYWKYAFGMPVVLILALIMNKPAVSMAESAVVNELASNKDSLFQDGFKERQKKIEDEDIKLNQSKKSILESDAINEINQSIISKNVSLSDLISDCREFEKAVASGDLERVKQILKTIDPDCLKLKRKNGSNLESVKSMVDDKKQSLKLTDSTNNNLTSCDNLQSALADHNIEKIRNILLNEDITCLDSGNEKTNNYQKLVKGQLQYGAGIYLGVDDKLYINKIAFEIYLDDEDPNCRDANYLELAQAIRNQDDNQVRNILATKNLACPLNQNGVTNDFIYIKELMKFDPKITNHNGKGITIYAFDFDLDLNDLNAIKKRKSPANKDFKENNEAALVGDIETILSVDFIDAEENTCLTLLDAVLTEDYFLAKNLLEDMDPNCFHRTTVSHTENGKVITKSDETLTPLVVAVSNGNLSLIELLLINDADPNYESQGEYTPLMLAVIEGNIQSVKKLIEYNADVNATNSNDYSVLDFANGIANKAVVKYLKSKGAKANHK